jgi:hypothetical protein
MTSNSSIGVYLNDHLGGSTAALELLNKMRSSNEGGEFGGVLDVLYHDVEADRAALETVMDGLGISCDPIKQAGGWMLEKLSRIKFNALVTGREDLSRLMEIEALCLGIEGKLAGWHTLKVLSLSGVGVDLDALIERASDQRSRLEPHRMDAARRAFP